MQTARVTAFAIQSAPFLKSRFKGLTSQPARFGNTPPEEPATPPSRHSLWDKPFELGCTTVVAMILALVALWGPKYLKSTAETDRFTACYNLTNPQTPLGLCQKAVEAGLQSTAPMVRE